VKWLKHAFAVDPDGPAEPTPLQQPSVDWVCIQIAKRRLTTPGLLFLEMCRPLNYIGAQSLHFLRPSIWAIVSRQSYANYVQFTKFLEHRGSIEYLAQRVEFFEGEFVRLEKSGQPVGKFIKEHLEQLASTAAEFEDNEHATTLDVDNA